MRLLEAFTGAARSGLFSTQSSVRVLPFVSHAKSQETKKGI